jgi:hypothetical protein
MGLKALRSCLGRFHNLHGIRPCFEGELNEVFIYAGCSDENADLWKACFVLPHQAVKPTSGGPKLQKISKAAQSPMPIHVPKLKVLVAHNREVHPLLHLIRRKTQ